MANDDAPSSFYSIQRAAAVAGVDERTIRRAIVRGELPASKRQGAYQITPDALADYRGRSGRPSSPAPPRRRDPVPLRLSTESGPVPAEPLPSPLTRLVGRERDTAAVRALLGQPEVRLVTLTGPGGIGKTRLAVRVAAESRSSFPQIRFVDLAPISDAELVASTIARAVGIVDASDQTIVARLRSHLAGQWLLLVLDNMEQVLGAAPLVVDLLTAAPNLKVLVTSRTRLHVSGEWAYTVPPLSLPPERAVTPESLLASEAGRLFVERAQAVASEPVLDEWTAPAVTAICRRLEGTPLAIELAAAWTRVLSPDALWARLSSQPTLPLLTGGPRDQPSRLRTMRDAIAWSHDLLSTEEQGVFRRLGAFVGGFTLEAAEALERGQRVAASRNEAPGFQLRPSTLDLIAALVDRSLLRRQAATAGAPRFGMLETVREFALERLAAAGADDTFRRHAEFFLGLAERTEPPVVGAVRPATPDVLDADMPNLRSALDWLTENQPIDGLRLAGVLGPVWAVRGLVHDGRGRLERALAAAPLAPPAVRGKAVRALGFLVFLQSDVELAEALFAEALDLFERAGEPARAADTVGALTITAVYLGQLTQGEALGLDALARAEALADRPTGEFIAAASLSNLGMIAHGQGDYGLASARLEEALARFRALGNAWGMSRTLQLAGSAARDLDRPDLALARYRECVALADRDGDPRMIGIALTGIASVLARSGDAARAACLHGATAAIAEHSGITLVLPIDRDAAAAGGVVAENALGPVAYAAAHAAGRELSIGDAVREALRDGLDSAGGRTVATAGDAYHLTEREREVLRLLAARQTDREIAEQLFVGVRTASWHVANVLGKLGVSSRRAAAALAVREGLA